MPPQSLRARLQIAVGVLRGAESQARERGARDVVEALRELQGAVRALIIATDHLDRLASSEALHGAAAGSHDGAGSTRPPVPEQQ